MSYAVLKAEKKMIATVGDGVEFLNEATGNSTEDNSLHHTPVPVSKTDNRMLRIYTCFEAHFHKKNVAKRKGEMPCITHRCDNLLNNPVSIN